MTRPVRDSTRRQSVDSAAKQTKREEECLVKIRKGRSKSRGRSSGTLVEQKNSDVAVECNVASPKNYRSTSVTRKIPFERRKSIAERPLNTIIDSDAYDTGSPTPDDDTFSL